MDYHFVQPGQQSLQPPKNPPRERLAGRIIQAVDLIQVVMVELIEQRREGGLDIGKVHDPAELRIRFPFDMNLDAKRVPVQPGALVSRGYVGEPVGRLDLENFMDVHGRPI